MGPMSIDRFDVNGPARDTAHTILCTECKRSSGPVWQGWRAIRTDAIQRGELPRLAFYCPDCAMHELGPPGRRNPPAC